jgi:RNA polymerase sigma-70 factor, ECF subfamily
MRISLSIPATLVEDDAEMAQSVLLNEPFSNGMDEAAFQVFYRETAPKFAGYIRRAAGDAALADDIFQEAYLRFLRICPAGLDERQQKAYLYRTASSLLVDHWRRTRRERLWSLLTPFKEAATDEIGARSEMGPDMQQMFAQLKPQEQTLLWMAYVEGFDHREIAAALELREKSVRVLLYRARRKMAGILTAEGIGPTTGSGPRPPGSGSSVGSGRTS